MSDAINFLPNRLNITSSLTFDGALRLFNARAELPSPGDTDAVAVVISIHRPDATAKAGWYFGGNADPGATTDLFTNNHARSSYSINNGTWEQRICPLSDSGEINYAGDSPGQAVYLEAWLGGPWVFSDDLPDVSGTPINYSDIDIGPAPGQALINPSDSGNVECVLLLAHTTSIKNGAAKVRPNGATYDQAHVGRITSNLMATKADANDIYEIEFSADAIGHHFVGYLPAGNGVIWLDEPAEVTFTEDGTWQDVNLTSETSADAVGVILEVDTASGLIEVMARHPDSTNTESGWSITIRTGLLFVGMDDSQNLEMFAANNNASVFILGYVEPVVEEVEEEPAAHLAPPVARQGSSPLLKGVGNDDTGLHNAALRNTIQHNQGIMEAPPDRIRIRSRRFFIEITDQDGAMLANLPKAILAARERSVNVPGSLTVVYPIDDDKAQYLVWPNEVRLYERSPVLATGVLVGVYLIGERELDYSGVGTITLQCDGLLALLGREPIEEAPNGYKKETAVSVQWLVGDWLNNYQEATDGRKIQFGSMSFAIATTTTTISLRQGETILSAMNRLTRIVGGIFFVTPDDRRLHWITYETGQRQFYLRTSKNVSVITQHEDHRGRANSLTIYGKGSSASDRVTPTDGNPILAPSHVGPRIKMVVTLPTVTDPTELRDRGRIIIERAAMPQYHYTIEAIDLSKSADGDVQFIGEIGAIAEGATTHIIDGKSGLTLDAVILSIHDVPDSPINTTLEVGDPAMGDPSLAGDRDSTGHQTPINELGLPDLLVDLLDETEDLQNFEDMGGGGGGLDDGRVITGDDDSWFFTEAESLDSLDVEEAPGIAYISAVGDGGDTTGYASRINMGAGVEEWVPNAVFFPVTDVEFLPTPQFPALGVVYDLDGTSTVYFHPGEKYAGGNGAWEALNRTQYAEPPP